MTSEAGPARQPPGPRCVRGTSVLTKSPCLGALPPEPERDSSNNKTRPKQRVINDSGSFGAMSTTEAGSGSLKEK